VADTFDWREKAAAIYDRLVARFGLGDDPGRRKLLFLRLAAACAKSEHAHVLCKRVAARALRTERPDRYFCSAALRELQSHGLVEEEEVEL
jgi:hypothetical protein